MDDPPEGGLHDLPQRADKAHLGEALLPTGQRRHVHTAADPFAAAAAAACVVVCRAAEVEAQLLALHVNAQEDLRAGLFGKVRNHVVELAADVVGHHAAYVGKVHLTRRLHLVDGLQEVIQVLDMLFHIFVA